MDDMDTRRDRPEPTPPSGVQTASTSTQPNQNSTSTSSIGANRAPQTLDKTVYDYVRCELLTWDDDVDNLGCREEALELQAAFIRHFGIIPSLWEIPNAANAQMCLENHLSTLTRLPRHRKELLIIHYGGHGESELDKVSNRPALVGQVGGSEKWKVDFVHCLDNQLRGCGKDVLLLLDCCCAAGLYRTRRDWRPTNIVVMAACGRNKTTPAKCKHTFTRRLIKSLKSFDTPFSIDQLAKKMIEQEPDEVRPLVYSEPGNIGKVATQLYLSPGRRQKPFFQHRLLTGLADRVMAQALLRPAASPSTVLAPTRPRPSAPAPPLAHILQDMSATPMPAAVAVRGAKRAYDATFANDMPASKRATPLSRTADYGTTNPISVMEGIAAMELDKGEDSADSAIRPHDILRFDGVVRSSGGKRTFQFPLNFPRNSLVHGRLTIGEVYAAVGHEIQLYGMSHESSLVLSFRGKRLLQLDTLCKAERIQHGDTVRFTVVFEGAN